MLSFTLDNPNERLAKPSSVLPGLALPTGRQSFTFTYTVLALELCNGKRSTSIPSRDLFTFRLLRGVDSVCLFRTGVFSTC